MDAGARDRPEAAQAAVVRPLAGAKSCHDGFGQSLSVAGDQRDPQKGKATFFGCR